MKRILSGLLGLLLAVGIVWLLVSNRQTALFSLDPFDAEAPAIAFGPVWTGVHIVAGLVIGFVLGAIGMWTSGGARRTELRARRREVRRLQEELREARQDVYRAEPLGTGEGTALVPTGTQDGRPPELVAHG